ncbi:hypothetical protein JB92DRAFT_3126081 [Gautieria morchelliformis]|nr:hypothetical protein JB92DRAFT_3126081 [Gautieria morchelliformis]
MVDEQTILVTSGQTLDDVYKYLDLTDERLTVATHTLDWRHMAATAPDTLALPVSLHKIPLSYLRRPTYTISATSQRPQRHYSSSELQRRNIDRLSDAERRRQQPRIKATVT